MASSAVLILDLTPPDLAVSIDSAAAVTSDIDVDLAIVSLASDKTQMKIYGDVNDASAPLEYRANEANAPWISFAASKSIRLSAGDGVKTIRVKVRDDVFNTSAEATDAITLNTAIPVITIGSPTPAKISKQATKDTATFTFSTDIALDQWEVRLVANAGDARGAGTLIPEAGGSDTQGGAIGAGGNQLVTIKGVDLESAGAQGGPTPEGVAARIKVFGRSAGNGQWSVGS